MDIHQIMTLLVTLFIMRKMELVRGETAHKVTFYLHDLSLYKNISFDTAVEEVAPAKDMIPLTNFGQMFVFDDELTAGPSSKSSAKVILGRAQGLYVYCGRVQPSALWSFTAFLDGKGSLSFHGAERIFANTSNPPQRSIHVTGGTGLYQNAHGIASISTIALKVPNYFVLRFDVTISMLS